MDALGKSRRTAATNTRNLGGVGRSYKTRVLKHPRFVVTRPLVPVCTRTPTVLEREHLIFIFGRVPGTQSFMYLSNGQFASLLSLMESVTPCDLRPRGPVRFLPSAAVTACADPNRMH